MTIWGGGGRGVYVFMKNLSLVGKVSSSMMTMTVVYGVSIHEYIGQKNQVRIKLTGVIKPSG